MKIVILLGRQGSGKGTQAQFLTKEFNLSYIGTGEILRLRAETPDFTGKKIKEVLERGDYLPTAVMCAIWMQTLELHKKTEDSKGIIFDGSPRKLFEAELFEQAFNWYEWSGGLQVFLIDISRQEAFNRLTHRRMCEHCKKPIPWIGKFKDLTACDACGGNLVTRADDTPDAINSRLDLFDKETLPVIDYYDKKGVLERVNGEASIEEVYESVKRLAFRV